MSNSNATPSCSDIFASIEATFARLGGRIQSKWTLDRNGIEGEKIIFPNDRELADLLVKAAAGLDVGNQILELNDNPRLSCRSPRELHRRS